GLVHGRLDGLGAVAERGVVGLQGPPAEEALALLLDDDLEESAAEGVLVGVARGEQGADAVGARLGQVDPQGAAARGEELGGGLDQAPRAVAGVVLAAAGAPVVQVDQGGDRVADEPVRPATLEVDQEADAATVVLVRRVVETLARSG